MSIRGGIEPLLLSIVAALAILLNACQPAALAAVPDVPSASPTVSPSPLPSEEERSRTPVSLAGITATVEPSNPPTPTSSLTPLVDPMGVAEVTPTLLAPSPTLALIESHSLSPENWKAWPVIPQVPASVRQIYRQGLAMGNDPYAFSILGDCQSLPETFLGVYDTDPALVASLPPDLQAVVAYFAGSFNRPSPTVKGGTTAGAILWAAWHENAYTCTPNESPLECELRLHKPSIVIINLGTHYETRNIIYLRKILDQLIARGVVPILSTKADNRELDERLNLEMALLAVEYNLPLWNFYAAVDDLPNNGVEVRKGEEHLGEIYLNEEGLERHRYTALQALAAVWRAVQAP